MSVVKNIIFCILILVVSILHAQQNHPHFIDGRIYVRFKAGTSDAQADSCFLKYRKHVSISHIERPFQNLGSDVLDRTVQVHFEYWNKTDEFLQQLSEEKSVELVEKCPLYKITYTPNDPASQWYLRKVYADSAWNIARGNSKIRIAIIDNGVLINHEDLKEHIWINDDEIPDNGLDDDLNGYVDDVYGYDVADRDNNPNPPQGIAASSPFNHGTHCAGVAAAVTDNGKGMASLAFNASIIPVKCTGDNSSGQFLTSSMNGVAYAMRNGAHVISMSFASPGYSSTDQTIISQAVTKGCVLVAASGNDNSQERYYPAAYGGVIAVAATGAADIKSPFSNVGSYVDVMAPGEGIYSTYANSTSAYSVASGTSMACPLVASLAALILSKNNSLLPWQVELIIKNNCDDISSLNPAFIGKIGTGRINAWKALQNTPEPPVPTNQPNITLFPNPFRDIINLDPGEHSYPDCAMIIYNVLGQQVYEKNFALNSKVILSLKGISPGYYFVELRNGATLVQRIRVVKH